MEHPSGFSGKSPSLWTGFGCKFEGLGFSGVVFGGVRSDTLVLLGSFGQASTANLCSGTSSVNARSQAEDSGKAEYREELPRTTHEDGNKCPRGESNTRPT